MTMLHETVETVETVETGLLRALTRGAETRAFPLIVAAVAMATTLSMTIPFGTLLVAAVLLAPRRWRSIAATSSIGAATRCALAPAASQPASKQARITTSGCANSGPQR